MSQGWQGISEKEEPRCAFDHSSFVFGIVVGNGAAAESVSEPLEPVAGDDLGVIPRGEGEAEAAIGDMSGLKLKMQELKREKSVLDFRRNRVEEDIAALQRAMQLIATTNGSKDIIASGLERG